MRINRTVFLSVLLPIAIGYLTPLLPVPDFLRLIALPLVIVGILVLAIISSPKASQSSPIPVDDEKKPETGKPHTTQKVSHPNLSLYERKFRSGRSLAELWATLIWGDIGVICFYIVIFLLNHMLSIVIPELAIVFMWIGLSLASLCTTKMVSLARGRTEGIIAGILYTGIFAVIPLIIYHSINAQSNITLRAILCGGFSVFLGALGETKQTN